jgi:hypothetical protein
MKTLRRSTQSKLETKQLALVLIEEDIADLALEWVTGCESCADDALTEFDYLLDAITHSDPRVTEYLLSRPAQCPFCSSPITEKTRIKVT